MFYDIFQTRFWRETDTFSSLHWPNWPRMTPLLTRVQPHRSRGRNHWTHGDGDATTHSPRLLCGLTEWRHTDLNHPLTPMTSNDHCTDHCTDHCLTTARLCNHWAMVGGVWWNGGCYANINCLCTHLYLTVHKFVESHLSSIRQCHNSMHALVHI